MYKRQAMGITYKVNMVPMYISMGMSQGIMPLISYNYASGNHKRMKKTVMFAARTALCFLIAVAIIYYTAAHGIISLFMRCV